jgi:two-component system sensor histidine kinase UhpB
MRHSKATRVDVVLRSDPESVELLVKDDGVGIAAAPPDQRSSGLGVVGMKERARAVGGELLLESAQGRGTSVRVRLPRLQQPILESA